MIQATTPAALRAALPGPNACALVPTMGNLHAGHLALIRQARESGLPVVCSIFVNRLQFDPGGDFDQYPRTMERDCELLAEAGCNIVFTPDETTLYPQPQRFLVDPDPALADILEGHVRPGFFRGVCTVVMKLFCIAQPAVAVFGKKDYQQLRVLQRMAEQFALPIRIEAGETCRAEDGLALSSRNGYLDPQQRRQAVALSTALQGLIEAWRQSPENRIAVESAASEQLTALGWQPDYLTIRRQSDLAEPGPGDSRLVALGAARLGGTRLIDNLEFDHPIAPSSQ